MTSRRAQEDLWKLNMRYYLMTYVTDSELPPLLAPQCNELRNVIQSLEKLQRSHYDLWSVVLNLKTEQHLSALTLQSLICSNKDSNILKRG